MSITTPGPNLTDLADKYRSDKGTFKHFYTELYHMLLSPWRDREIRFLEMGLLIGGPEHGNDVDRETRDLPSVRMWLEFFTKAQIIGLDVSDFSWFEHDRFEFVRCDMDDRSNIQNAMGAIGVPDIVIDDASHASHHQQNAFLEIFPKMPSGGIYIIEDLRWQPPAYERKQFTKTAAVFQSYLYNRKFWHRQPEYSEQLNNLIPMISGCFIHQAKFKKTARDQVLVVHKR